MSASSMGEVSGTVAIRPVRLGLAMAPTVANVVRAAQHATSSWGGLYFPILPTDDMVHAKQLARAFMVDVIVALDDDAKSRELEDLPGFRWRGRSPYGPLDPPQDGVTYRVLDASILIQGTKASRDRPPLVHPRWDPDDACGALYSIWYGQYESSDYGNKLRAEFADISSDVSIAPVDLVPNVESHLTPLGLTSLGVRCTSYGQGIGFFALDIDDPNDLIAFWNIRADGGDVFPWPLGLDDRISERATAWLDSALAAGRVPRPRMGTGEEGPLQVHFWSRQGNGIPERLTSLLEAREVEPWSSLPDARPVGWTGSIYPLTTEFDDSFTSAVDDQGLVEIAFPQVDFLPRRRGLFSSGVIAAQIEISSERQLPPGFVVAIPNIRRLSSLLQDYAEYPEPFQRGTGDGRIVGISADAHRLQIRPISSFSIIENLFADSGWSCSQTDDGRFTGRLIELLGGLASNVANQPAVRAVLSKAAGSHRGKPIPSLIGEAKRYKGSWPGPITHPENVRRYPQQVVNYLLARKLLRPVLPVKCPRCATETGWSPEDLATTLNCPMCEEAFPLGLALSLAGTRFDWLCRLAGNIPAPKLAETFPIMATLAVLAQYRSFSIASLPHVLGLKVDLSGESREIDILAALDDRGLPVLIAAETKSYRDEIDERDLDTLARVQRYFHSAGLEAFVLVATLRESFEDSAVQALRAFCDNAPETLHYTQGERLALPITLVARDLSAHPMADEHPTKWERHSSTVADFAMESCRRNLGLDRVEYFRSDGGYGSRLVWS